MFKIVLLALLATPNPKYLELSDGYAVRTSDINTIAKSFCANSSAIRSERWQLIQLAQQDSPSIAVLRLGVGGMRVREGLHRRPT